MSNPKPRVLAIDNRPANLLTLKATLAPEFVLQFANSGAQGLAMAIECPPDLILIDVMMSEMDGYETCRTAIPPIAAYLGNEGSVTMTGTGVNAALEEALACSIAIREWKGAYLLA